MSRGRWIRRALAVAALGAGAAYLHPHIQFSANSETRDAKRGANHVPLIKAEAGHFKIKPADPGGIKVPHKDKAIYDRIATKRKIAPAGEKAKGKAQSGGGRTRAKDHANYRIQLGAFRTAAIARARWAALTKRHRDLLGKLKLVVDKADLGARGTWFRLQAGPVGSAEDAHKLCRALASRKLGCLLVKS